MWYIVPKSTYEKYVHHTSCLMNGKKTLFIYVKVQKYYHRMDKIFGTLNKIIRIVSYLRNVTQIFIILILSNYFLLKL
jgi:hypothetical protein